MDKGDYWLDRNEGRVMTDKELIRRAILGSREAQQECTEKGIVLPCPFCGSDSKVFADIDLFGIRCVDSTCIGHDMRAEYYSRCRVIEDWNTRPAPPVGRCKDCLWYLPKSKRCKYSLGGLWGEVNELSFCSCFNPKED